MTVTSEVWPVAILFDLDGTLVDSAPDLADVLNDLLAEKGHMPLDEAAVRRMIGDGVPKLCERGFAARGLALNPAEIESQSARFLELYEPRATLKSALFPQVGETVEALVRARKRLGVLTNKPAFATRLILEGLGISGAFDVVVGGDSGLPKKPDPAVVYAAMKQLGAVRESTLMVGDSAADVGAARAAGISVVVVEHGYTTVPPHELGADRVIRDFGALYGCLAEMGAAC